MFAGTKRARGDLAWSSAQDGGSAQAPWVSAASSLRAVATQIQPTSDKFTTHKYQTMYGMFLMSLKGQPVKFLEIGLGCDMTYGPGARVALWKDLLLQAELWEAEYNQECVESSRAKGQLNGVHTLVGDQGDVGTVQRWVVESGGNFDVIIDDGGHRNTQIRTSFDVLWPTLKPGGVYFLEDLQVGRSQEYDDTHGTAVMADLVHDWTEQLLIRPGERSQQRWPLPQGLEFILCQKEACALGKA